jgi:4-amino-4-deoxy-L-arabinose transferase-like glycosyltransferase
LVIGSFLFGVAAILAGLVFSPSFVAERFSSDGVLARSTIIKICILRWGALFIGVLFILYGILRLTRSDYGRKIDSVIEEIVFPRIKQSRTIIGIIFVLLALVSLNQGLNLALNDDWKNVTGAEYYNIAESLARGHGYSLPASGRWYFIDFISKYSDDEYYPTALEEPIYPSLLAFALKYLGNYGRLVILLFHMAALYFTSFLIYCLVRKVFDSRLGIIASIGLLMWWPYTRFFTQEYFLPSTFGGLNICCSAYLLLWFLEKITIKRGIILGVMLGFSCLTMANGMLFVPLAVLLTFIVNRPVKPLAWRPALAIIVSTGIVISPWALRNLIVFGQLIPVRTGFGLALHQGNPTLAATFSTGTHACVDTLGPMWHAENAEAALEQARNEEAKRFAIYKRSYDCIELEAPDNFSAYNEAQKDKVYLGKSVDFIISNPKTFVSLTYFRMKYFFVGWGGRRALIAFLALIGGLMAWRNQRAAIMVLLVFVYSFTYSITVIWFYSYRYPIEPIMFVLSSNIPIIVLSKIKLVITSQIS